MCHLRTVSGLPFHKLSRYQTDLYTVEKLLAHMSNSWISEYLHIDSEYVRIKPKTGFIISDAIISEVFRLLDLSIFAGGDSMKRQDQVEVME